MNPTSQRYEVQIRTWLKEFDDPAKLRALADEAGPVLRTFSHASLGTRLSAFAYEDPAAASRLTRAAESQIPGCYVSLRTYDASEDTIS